MLLPLREGPLATIHKATIAIAVLGFFVYALWEGRNFQVTGEPGAALGSFAGLAGTIVAALYLRALLGQEPDRR